MKKLTTFLMILTFAILTTQEGMAQTAGQYLAAGNQVYQTRNYPLAARNYLAAAQVDASSSAAYQGLGNCYYMMGDKADALFAYERASNLNPGNTQLTAFIQGLKAQVNGNQAMVVASAATYSASSPAPVLHSDASGYWVINIQGGIGLALSSQASQTYNLGFGGEVMGGYCLDGNLTLGFLAGYNAYPYKSGNTSYNRIPLEGVVEYSLGKDKLKPFGVLGLGVDLNSVAGASSTDLLMDPGIGLLYSVSDKVDLYLLAKLTMDFPSQSGGDSPTMFLPISVGASFDLK